MELEFPHNTFKVLACYKLPSLERSIGCFTAVETLYNAYVALFRFIQGQDICNMTLVYSDGYFKYGDEVVSIVEENIDSDLESKILRLARTAEYYDIKDYHSYLNNKINHQLCLNIETDRIYKLGLFDKKLTSVKINDNWTYPNICMWYKEAGELINDTPKLNFFKKIHHIYEFKTDIEKSKFLQLHYCVPNSFKKYFKSPKHAYKMSLDFYDIGRKNRFGYTCKSKDDHICNSLAEAEIDDFLFTQGIKHEKEPKYPGSNWRADFKVNDIYIEYFGLSGINSYDEKTKAKIEYAEKNNINLICIFPDDMQGLYKTKILEKIIV